MLYSAEIKSNELTYDDPMNCHVDELSRIVTCLDGIVECFSEMDEIIHKTRNIGTKVLFESLMSFLEEDAHRIIIASSILNSIDEDLEPNEDLEPGEDMEPDDY